MGTATFGKTIAGAAKACTAALLLLALAGCVGSGSQISSYCAPGLKFAAGACVQSCPAGYDDRGRICIYRSLGT